MTDTAVDKGSKICLTSNNDFDSVESFIQSMKNGGTKSAIEGLSHIHIIRSHYEW